MANNTINSACDAALRRLANGDMSGLEEIYDTLGRRIFVLSLSILRDPYSAEDIMQDTFIKIAAGASGYRPGSNAAAFILTVTRNLSFNLLRRREREFSSDIIPDPAAPEPEQIPFRALDALSLLDEEERQIVTLRLDCGMKHREVAELLGITTAAAEKKYRRALVKLKKYYE